VVHAHDAAARDLAGKSDDSGTRRPNRLLRGTSEIHTPMTGQPRLWGRVEPPCHPWYAGQRPGPGRRLRRAGGRRRQDGQGSEGEERHDGGDDTDQARVGHSSSQAGGGL
jgi:hypothetical protein